MSQGSNLGPLEFLIFINDLPEAVSTARCLLFADDLKMFIRVRNQDDCLDLQRDINNVWSWSKKNKLFFNENKCSIISFGRSKNPITAQYKMGNAVLTRVDNVRDLGVIMSEDMSFRLHINKICAKSFRTLGFVLRQARHLDSIPALKSLYNALIRSRLESNAMVWCPYEAKYVQMVEKIQKKFLRWLYTKQYGYFVGYPFLYPSAFLLGMMGYNTLEVRRVVSMIQYVVNVFVGRRCNSSVLENILMAVPDNYMRARRHTLFAVPGYRTELGRQAPLPRVLRLLNDFMRQYQGLDLIVCTPIELHRTLLAFAERYSNLSRTGLAK